MPVDAALARVLEDARPLGPERLELGACLGRALAEPLVAPFALPRFTSSAMDGYAVHAADTAGASAEAPVGLPVNQRAYAGGGPRTELARGQAARITTGALLPAGADAVVPQEETRQWAHDGVAIVRPIVSGQFVRPAGEDLEAGEEALPAGTALGPAELGLAAALGRRDLWVWRRPRVAVVTMGDELIEPGEPLPPGAIYDANGLALTAAAREAGAEIAGVARAPDDPEAIARAIGSCRGADLLLTIGGVSVGDRDHVRPVLEDLGARLDFWRVAMRPGKPLLFGRWEDRPVLGLPGNPVSALVTFEVFGRPLLRRIGGHRATDRVFVEAELTAPVDKPSSLTLFCRGRCDDRRFFPAKKQASNLFTSIARQDAMAELPPGPARVEAGERIRVRLLPRAAP